MRSVTSNGKPHNRILNVKTAYLKEDKPFFTSDTKPKPNRTPTVKVDKAVYARYFKPSQPAKEVQDIVEKALEMYFEQQKQ